MSTPDPVNARLKHGKRLTPAQKQAIVAAVAVKGSIHLVAQEFGVHRNTVAELVKAVRHEVPQAGFGSTWRQKLTEELPAKSVDAIERSLNDTNDIHKAAGTALSHLKGIGVLQNEGSTSVNVLINQVNGLPDDWRERYISADTPPPVVVDLPNNGAGDTSSE